MARISMIVCDLCKEEIKEDETAYAIVLSLCVDDNKSRGIKRPGKEESGEICVNCHRSLVSRLNKSPADLLRAPKMPLTFPPAAINPQKPAQFLDCITTNVGAAGLQVGKSATVEFSDGPINSVDAKQIGDGEFKVASRAHTIPRQLPPKCTHDKKSFGDDGKFICLVCQEVLGSV